MYLSLIATAIGQLKAKEKFKLILMVMISRGNHQSAEEIAKASLKVIKLYHSMKCLSEYKSSIGELS